MKCLQHTNNVHVVDARTFDLATHTVIPFPDLGYLITSPFYSPASSRSSTPTVQDGTSPSDPISSLQDRRDTHPAPNHSAPRSLNTVAVASPSVVIVNANAQWASTQQAASFGNTSSSPDAAAHTRPTHSDGPSPMQRTITQDQRFPRIPTDGRASSDRLLVEDREQDLRDDPDLILNPSMNPVNNAITTPTDFTNAVSTTRRSTSTPDPARADLQGTQGSRAHPQSITARPRLPSSVELMYSEERARMGAVSALWRVEAARRREREERASGSDRARAGLQRGQEHSRTHPQDVVVRSRQPIDLYREERARVEAIRVEADQVFRRLEAERGRERDARTLDLGHARAGLRSGQEPSQTHYQRVAVRLLERDERARERAMSALGRVRLEHGREQDGVGAPVETLGRLQSQVTGVQGHVVLTAGGNGDGDGAAGVTGSVDSGDVSEGRLQQRQEERREDEGWEGREEEGMPDILAQGMGDDVDGRGLTQGEDEVPDGVVGVVATTALGIGEVVGRRASTDVSDTGRRRVYFGGAEETSASTSTSPPSSQRGSTFRSRPHRQRLNAISHSPENQAGDPLATMIVSGTRETSDAVQDPPLSLPQTNVNANLARTPSIPSNLNPNPDADSTLPRLPRLHHFAPIVETPEPPLQSPIHIAGMCFDPGEGWLYVAAQGGIVEWRVREREEGGWGSGGGAWV
ncbi:hypothetical protein K439DRAFT_774100 [Ramaria rubella]|nr:hypothetical protein K439DRAFT_774100 [Ramaria rubella]